MIAFERFCANAWNWDLLRFCEAMDFDPRSHYAREKFSEFQQAAAILGQFDSQKLARLCEERPRGEFRPFDARLPKLS